MNILITGGAGFIGSHTADALIATGHRVRVLDNLQQAVHPAGKPAYLHPDIEFIYGDVRERSAWEAALKGIDAVYHLAAYQDYLTDFSTFFHVNAVSTALLYEVLVATGQYRDIHKIIVAASQAVMGEGRYRCPACHPEGGGDRFPRIRSEAQLSRGQWDHLCPDCDAALQWQASDESVVAPCNQYALSKHSQEQIAVELGRRYAVPSAVMRYSIVQGPRQSLHNAYSGAMRIFALSLMMNRPPTLFEDGRQVRDYVNIQDVVAANLLVLDHPEADTQVFNVGGGMPWTVAEFYAAMQDVVGRRLDPVVGRFYRFGDTRHIFSDTSRLRSLGWRPRFSIYNSIADYWRYLQGQDGKSEILEYAEARMKQQGVIRDAGTPA
ncbi:MAG: NAD-dependent epimerase/dehydratase family protein [Pseudomonadota bacterium]